MKKTLTTILLIAVFFSLKAQQQNPYENTLSFGSGEFFQNGQRLRMKEVLEITKVNDEAYSLVKKARTNKTMAGVFTYPGSFAIGYGFGGALAGGSIEWGWVGAGAGLLTGGVLFALAYNKKAQLATEAYNAGRPYANQGAKQEWSFGMQRNGLGLSLKF
ncbi:hypothetical protein [Cecembia sp.]|uniref:hypothetical protein n=1 Tax=Cecembia sp. TaxID=1898110 RepID=UPI0025BF7C8D|nr:hypothetical protein [Cecembia sp.]